MHCKMNGYPWSVSWSIKKVQIKYLRELLMTRKVKGYLLFRKEIEKRI